ncbi:unnamed protein product [Penicillium manginii]
MLHGKKGFERIVWAFKNVLNQSLAWLFCDLDPTSQNDESKPIKNLHPQLLESAPTQTKLEGVLTPSLQKLVSKEMPEAVIQDRCGGLSEWIAMVQLRSPHISTGDSVDPYLSRYSVPEFDEKATLDLVCLKWHGFISSAWTMQIFLNLL